MNFKKKFELTQYARWMVFLGYREDYKELIAASDLFLNPPRQGSGTGAMWSAMAGVPVITLDDCDVESESGKEFVCGTVDEMPGLVMRYLMDKTFYKRQSRLIKERAEKERSVDSIGNIRKFCESVKEITLLKEEEARHEG